MAKFRPRHPAADLVPIRDAAVALGLPLTGRSVPCYAAAAHAVGGDPCLPTLVLNSDNNTYNCSACEQGGDLLDLVRQVRQVGPRRAVRWLEELAADPDHAPWFGLFTTPRAPTPDDAAVEVYADLYIETQPIGDLARQGVYPLGAWIGQRLEVAPTHLGTVVECGQALLHRLGGLGAAGLDPRIGRFPFCTGMLLWFTFDGGRPVYVEGAYHDFHWWPWTSPHLPAGLDPPAPFNAEVLAEAHDTVYVCEGAIQTLRRLQLGLPAVGVPGVTLFRPEWVERFGRARRVRFLWRDDATTRRFAAEVGAAFRGRGIAAEVHHKTRLPGVPELAEYLAGIAW